MHRSVRRTVLQFLFRTRVPLDWLSSRSRLPFWSKPGTIRVCVSVLFIHAGMLAPQARAQNVPTPKILTPFEQQALLAFNPGSKALSSLTLTGNAVWTAGSLQETGSVVLKASADGSMTETWTLPSQSHTHAATAWSAGRSCNLIDHKGVAHANSDSNCMRSLSWFAPWLGLGLISEGPVLASDTTQPADTANGHEKLAFQTGFSSAAAPGGTGIAELAQLESRAAMTVTFDQKTALPETLDFDQILDSDPAHVIKYQIVFSDFRAEAGYMFPHHLQRYIQRTLQADITITSVNVE